MLYVFFYYAGIKSDATHIYVLRDALVGVGSVAAV